MSAEDRQEQRRSMIRDRQDVGGNFGGCLRLPDGIGWYSVKEGRRRIEVIPFPSGPGNPVAEKPGTMYYERTYWRYRRIGADEKAYVCSSKTFGEKDYLAELVQAEKKKSKPDKEFLKSLNAQKMSACLVYDHDQPEKGLQCLDYSFANFLDVLLERIQTAPESKGWDWFFWPDKTGFTLEVSFKEDSFDSRNYVRLATVDFEPRSERVLQKVQQLYQQVKDNNWCVDSFLIKTPYEKLKSAYLMLGTGGGDDDHDHGHSRDDRRDGGSETSKTTRDRETPTQTETTERGSVRDAGGDTDEEKITRVIMLGRDSFGRGEKKSDCPFDEGTDRFSWWMAGWKAALEDSLDKKDKEQEKAESAAKKTKPVTAESLGIRQGDFGIYDGSKYEVLRINSDGSLNLLSESGDSVARNVPVSDFKPNKGSSQQESTARTAEKDPDDTPPSSEKRWDAKQWEDV